jgi:hypothetical protein
MANEVTRRHPPWASRAPSCGNEHCSIQAAAQVRLVSRPPPGEFFGSISPEVAARVASYLARTGNPSFARTTSPTCRKSPPRPRPQLLQQAVQEAVVAVVRACLAARGALRPRHGH